MNRATIEKRVTQAAESALYHQLYVCPIDIFLGLGWLQPSHVKEWKQGRVFCLEKVIHASPPRVSFAMKCFRSWIHKKGLKGSHTFYRRQTKGPKTELQFSLSGNPQIERFYSVHYVSPLLSAAKQKNLQTKLEKPPELPVFIIINDAECARCQQKLPKGNFLFKEVNQALCLKCARLDHLVFLPSEDAKLTRETKKQSASHFVVLKFSTTRGHYERQRLLVEQKALARIFHPSLLRKPGRPMDTALDLNLDSESMDTYSHRPSSALALSHQPSQLPRHESDEISGLDKAKEWISSLHEKKEKNQ